MLEQDRSLLCLISLKGLFQVVQLIFGVCFAVIYLFGGGGGVNMVWFDPQLQRFSQMKQCNSLSSRYLPLTHMWEHNNALYWHHS